MGNALEASGRDIYSGCGYLFHPHVRETDAWLGGFHRFSGASWISCSYDSASTNSAQLDITTVVQLFSLRDPDSFSS